MSKSSALILASGILSIILFACTTAKDTVNTFTADWAGGSYTLRDTDKEVSLHLLTEPDIDFLIQIPRLRTLSISESPITDLSILTELRELNYLVLSNLPITDIQVLSSMPELSMLEIYTDQDIDLEPLSGMNLEYLCLSKPEFNDDDLRNIASISSLRRLYLHGDSSDPSILSALTQLTELGFTSSGLTDISFVSTMSGIKELSLSGNNISSVDELSLLEHLELLDLYDNRITGISKLNNLSKLRQLDIGKNHISSLQGIQYMVSLVTLDACDNQITEILPLIELINSRDNTHPLEVHLDGNVVNVSDLTNLPDTISIVTN